MSLKTLSKMTLVGGTSLALRFGHRKSIDIDLFGPEFDKMKVLKELISFFGNKVEFENTSQEWCLFCYIDDVKVVIIKYDHPIIKPFENIDRIRLSSVEDIAAMKMQY